MKKIDYLEQLLIESQEYAKSLSDDFLLIEHILGIFLENEEVDKLLSKYNVNVQEIKSELQDFLHNPKLKNIDDSNKVEILLAYYYAGNLCNSKLVKDDKNLFIVNLLGSFLLLEDTFAQSILQEHHVDGYTLDKIFSEFSENYMENYLQDIVQNNMNALPFKPNTNNNENNLTIKYTKNLEGELKKLSRFYGREEEIELAQQILYKRYKANLLIIGKPGSGKTRFALEVLKKVFSNNSIHVLKLDIPELTSNIMLKGELETRIKSLYESFDKKQETILFIDDVNRICSSDVNSLTGDIANALNPFLQTDKIKIIGTVNSNELYKIEKNEEFIDNFFKINLPELSEEHTLSILKSLKKSYEKYFGCTYKANILKLIIKCSERFITNKCLPMKAVDVMDTLGALAKYENISEPNEEMVYKAISKYLDVPIESISQDEKELYLNLEDNLMKEVMGQDEAIKKLVDSIVISRSGLRENDKTAVSLMFIGASGVGKTEICKVLSKSLNIPLIRYDMSEYMEDHTVSRLIGAPPGYIGYNDGKSGGGLLISQIEETPHCILLLDEIEKASPKVHNLFLQVMDNGKLTSTSGKTVSFEHVYLIMTSNVGSQVAHKKRIGFGNEDDVSRSEEEFNNSFLPEFRSRIDSTITFNNLSDEVLHSIAQKFMNELKEVLADKNIKFKYSLKILDYIVEKTKKVNNGARPIKHIITNEIKNVIAKKIVFDDIKKVDLDIIDGKLEFGG